MPISADALKTPEHTHADGEHCESCARTREAPWTFLTNHSHVLLCLAREPEQTLRNVAVCVGITERAVQRIVADLEEAAILTRSRDGRRNRYEVHAGQPLRHAIEAH